MSRKTNTTLIALLGTILMGLSTWVLISLIELQTIVAMMQQELFSLDKVFGRSQYYCTLKELRYLEEKNENSRF